MRKFFIFNFVLCAALFFASTAQAAGHCVCKNNSGQGEVNDLGVADCNAYIGKYDRCNYYPQVQYCCCRAGMQCGQLTAYLDDRACGSANFPNQSQLPNNQYTVKDVPPNGCSALNVGSLAVQGTCYGKVGSDNTHCQTPTGGQCANDPKCYWAQCVAKKPENQAYCNQKKNSRTDCDTDPLCAYDTSIQGATVGPSSSAPITTVPVEKTINLLQTEAADTLNPGGFTSATNIIGVIIRFLLVPIGSFALVMYIYAGALWMMAAGNSEQTEKAKIILVWTTLGLVALVSSYAVVTAAFKAFNLAV